MTRVPPGFWRAATGGLCATLLSVGLARFAYTPLIPALIDAAWFSPAAAAWLGAINLAGYLAGALVARALAARWPAPALLRASMAAATVSLFACAWPLDVVWMAAWRAAAGIAGGLVMVLAAPTVLPLAPPARRGLASGIVFTGVGSGILASATLVPLLLGVGLVETWCGLGLASAALTAVAWNAWPTTTPVAGAAPARTGARPPLPGAAWALWIQYGLNATGLVPVMVFLVDFVARGLGQGLAVGASYWVLYGIGAVAGPLVAARLADRIGFGPTFRWAWPLQGLVIALPLVTTHPAALGLMAVVAGVFTPGTVPLAFGRAQEVSRDPAVRARAWSGATASFALFQAAGAAVCSALFARTGSHLPLFALGAGALLLAFVLDLVLARRDVSALKRVNPIQP